MADHRGPWASGPVEPPQKPPRPRASFQFGLWIGVIVAVGAVVWGLSRLFPGAITSDQDWSRVAYGLGLVAVVSAGLLRTRRVSLGRSARRLAIWAALLVGLALGYSYRGELGAIATRLRGQFAPEVGVRAGPHELVVGRDDQDNFALMGQVNGQTVRFVIDTGASEIVLSPADARRLGVDVAKLTFPELTETANGLGHTAPFKAQSLEVGGLKLSNVAMAINATPMSSSLLGMSFLKQLNSFQEKDGRLYLRWRG